MTALRMLLIDATILSFRQGTGKLRPPRRRGRKFRLAGGSTVDDADLIRILGDKSPALEVQRVVTLRDWASIRPAR
jgi:hypothetical protein